MAIIKMYCSRGYRTESYELIGGFGEQVSAGVYGNAGTFTTPPLTALVFDAAVADYQSKRGAYTQGGINHKEAFMLAYGVLIGHLNTMANYVDTVADGNSTIIQMGGFVATKGETTAASRHDQLTGLKVLSNTGGTVSLTCDLQRGINAYICIATEGAPLPDSVKVTPTGKVEFPPAALNSIRSMIIDARAPRRKSFSGLEPGSRYYFAYAAINTAGVGTLSAPIAVVVAI